MIIVVEEVVLAPGEIGCAYDARRGLDFADEMEYSEGWLQVSEYYRVLARYTRVSHSAYFWQIVQARQRLKFSAAYWVEEKGSRDRNKIIPITYLFRWPFGFGHVFLAHQPLPS